MGRRRLEVLRQQLPKSQQRVVDEFWRQQQEETEATMDFNERMLPMARLKKVIRVEEDSMMISSDTPAFLAKLCEFFTQELTMRAWACAESHERHIILDSDIAEAVASTEYYDFLANALLRYLSAQRGFTSTPSAKLITRKRHRTYPDPVSASRHLHCQGRHEVQFPIFTMPAPARVHYMPFSHMLPPPTMASRNTPAVHDYYCPAFLVANNVDPFVVGNVDPFVVGNTDPNVVATKFVEESIVNYCEETDGNDVSDIADGKQQKQKGGNVDGHHESVEVEQDGAVVGEGEKNESLVYKYVADVLMDEDQLYPDNDLYPVSTSLGLENFIGDQDVLDEAFSNPSSNTASSNN